jgi:hypothetical protein
MGNCGGTEEVIDVNSTAPGAYLKKVMLEFDACGVCGGEGIPEGECDCQGNKLDCN